MIVRMCKQLFDKIPTIFPIIYLHLLSFFHLHTLSLILFSENPIYVRIEYLCNVFETGLVIDFIPFDTNINVSGFLCMVSLPVVPLNNERWGKIRCGEMLCRI